MKSLFGKRIVDDCLYHLSVLIESQRYGAHLIVMDQVGGAVDGIQYPVGAVGRKIPVFLFFGEEACLRGFLRQFPAKIFLHGKIYLCHIVCGAFYSDRMRHVFIHDNVFGAVHQIDQFFYGS